MTTGTVRAPIAWNALSAEEGAARIEALLRDHPDTPEGRVLAHLKWCISMLAPDVLALVHEFAGATRGAIVEIGTYIGGATVAAALGAWPGRPMVSLEIGGAHDHDTIASEDIFLDLQRSLLDWGVHDRVVALNTDAREPAALEIVQRLIGGDGIGLLMIDSDGDIGRDIANLEAWLRPGCLLIADDYVSVDDQTGLAEVYPGYAADKMRLVKSCIDAMVAEGRLVPFGVYGYGTWVGRFR